MYVIGTLNTLIIIHYSLLYRGNGTPIETLLLARWTAGGMPSGGAIEPLHVSVGAGCMEGLVACRVEGQWTAGWHAEWSADGGAVACRVECR